MCGVVVVLPLSDVQPMLSWSCNLICWVFTHLISCLNTYFWLSSGHQNSEIAVVFSLREVDKANWNKAVSRLVLITKKKSAVSKYPFVLLRGQSFERERPKLTLVNQYGAVGQKTTQKKKDRNGSPESQYLVVHNNWRNIILTPACNLLLRVPFWICSTNLAENSMIYNWRQHSRTSKYSWAWIRFRPISANCCLAGNSANEQVQ